MRRLKWLLAVPLLALILLIALLSRPAPSLLDRAKLIGENIEWYEWLPNNHLATNRRDGRPGFRTWVLVSESHLAPADDSELGKEIAGLPSGRQWSVSPDGKHVSIQFEGRFDQVVVRPLGRLQNKPRKIAGRTAHWAPSGGVLAALAGPPNTPMLKRYSFSNFARPFVVSTTPDLPKWSPLRAFRGGSVTVPGQRPGVPGSFAVQWSAPAPRLLGITPRNSAILTTWNPGQIQDVDLFEVSLETSGKPIRTFTIEIPKGYRADEVQLSPQADRLIMRLYGSTATSGFVSLLERLGVYRPSSRSATDEYWVTNLDGTKRHKLGHISTTPHGTIPSFEAPTRIRWLPDGKSISFTTKMNDGLYVIDAPE